MKSSAKQVVAAGGVAVRLKGGNPEVLLIRRDGRWDLPKGHLEKPETVEECALREVEEETGASPLSIDRFLCKTYHEYLLNGDLIGKTTYWYLMWPEDASVDLTPETSEGITDASWTSLSEARELVYYDNLRDVLQEVNPGEVF